MELNNKGFSVLKVILIIVLLVVLLLLAKPSYKYIKYVIEKSTYKSNISKIESIAVDYATDNVTRYKYCYGNAGSNCLISIDTLKNQNYIYDDKILTNPKDNSIIDGSVLVCYSSINGFNGTYVDDLTDMPTCESKDGESGTSYQNKGTLKENILNSGDDHLKQINGEYRYFGNDAYNYVEIDNTTWRIIGIIDNGFGYKLVKLANNSMVIINKFSNGSTTYNDSDAMDYLNNGDYFNALGDSVKNILIQSNFKVANCSSKEECVSESSYGTWTGNIAILSIKDLALSTNCGNLSCLDTSYFVSTNEFLLDFNNGSIYKTDFDGVIVTENISGRGSARPVIFIDENASISGGNGTKTNPFRIKSGD